LDIKKFANSQLAKTLTIVSIFFRSMYEYFVQKKTLADFLNCYNMKHLSGVHNSVSQPIFDTCIKCNEPFRRCLSDSSVGSGFSLLLNYLQTVAKVFSKERFPAIRFWVGLHPFMVSDGRPIGSKFGMKDSIYTVFDGQRRLPFIVQ
jgi:hypothetical protein